MKYLLFLSLIIQTQILSAEPVYSVGKYDANLARHGRASGFVAITYDDGHWTDTTAWRIMKQYGLPAGVCIIGDKIGTKDCMDSTTINRMYKEGAEIISHSQTHPNFDTLNVSAMERELLNSKKRLEQVITDPKYKCVSFAYPYGAVNSDSIRYTVGRYYRFARGELAVKTLLGYNKLQCYGEPADNWVVKGDTSTTKAKIDSVLRNVRDLHWFLTFYLHSYMVDTMDIRLLCQEINAFKDSIVVSSFENINSMLDLTPSSLTALSPLTNGSAFILNWVNPFDSTDIVKALYKIDYQPKSNYDTTGSSPGSPPCTLFVHKKTTLYLWLMTNDGYSNYNNISSVILNGNNLNSSNTSLFYFSKDSTSKDSIPDKVVLSLPAPSPSINGIVIKYSLPERETVSLTLYDISGRLVKTLCSGIQEKGYHTANIKGNELAKGVYFLELFADGGEADTFKATRKLTILK